MPLWIRAVMMTVLLPGVVAGMVPVWIATGRCAYPLPLGAGHWVGVVPLGAGLAILGLTIRDFFEIGHGTLAPWDAPTALVHQRLYSRVRNPMYLGVLATILGQALLQASGGVFAYLGLMTIVFHLRVIRFEEPALERKFGAAYTAYRAAVPRWIPARSRS